MKLEQIAKQLIAILIYAGFFLLGVKIGGATERMKAIEQGVAHWQVNERTGETKFTYRKP
jgi:hypothetical protein